MEMNKTILIFFLPRFLEYVLHKICVQIFLHRWQSGADGDRPLSLCNVQMSQVSPSQDSTMHHKMTEYECSNGRGRVNEENTQT